MAITDADRDYIRLLVSDRLPPGGNDQDAYFSNAVIDDIYSRMGDNVYLAAYEGWLIKAAEYADMIDKDESGSKRKLSQLYKQAINQAEVMFGKGGGSADGTINSSFAIVGRPLTLRERPAITDYVSHKSRRIPDPNAGLP